MQRTQKRMEGKKGQDPKGSQIYAKHCAVNDILHVLHFRFCTVQAMWVLRKSLNILFNLLK